MFIAPKILAGKRVLIVEDELIQGMVIEELLLECGCIPVGPCGNVAQALEAVQAGSFDMAVLDVNLGGEMVYPVAHALTAQDIPFLFMSGYGEAAIASRPGKWRVCAKPFEGDEFAAKLAAVLEDFAMPLHAEGQSTPV